MDARKPEQAPKWLLGLALSALGLSGVATRFWEPTTTAQPIPKSPVMAIPTSAVLLGPRFERADSSPLEESELSEVRQGTAHGWLSFGPTIADPLTVAPPAIDVLADADWRAYVLSGRMAAPAPSSPPNLLVLLPTPSPETPRLYDPHRAPQLSDRLANQALGSLSASGRYAAELSGRSSWSRRAMSMMGAASSAPTGAPAATRATSPPAADQFQNWLGSAGQQSQGLGPQSLFEQLDRLTYEPATAAWARQTIAQIRSYTRATTPWEQQHALAELTAASRSAAQLAETTGSPRLATLLRQAHFAIERRIAVWQSTNSIAARNAQQLIDGQREMIARIASRTADLSGLGPMIVAPNSTEVSLPASEEVDPTEIVAEVEQYERDASPSQAAVVARERREYIAANDPEVAELAEALEANYRNANLRIALADRLIERYLPQPDAETQPLRQRIGGAAVSGWSTASSRVSVELIPDSQAWRGMLVAQGAVNSQTAARGGPAVLRNQGVANYVARKPVALAANGVAVQPAAAKIASQSQLVGLSTQYDGIPLLGAYVRGRAHDAYRAQRGLARTQTESQVRHRVCQRVDSRLEEALAEGRERYNRQVSTRLEGLGLSLTPVELRTSENRLIARLRVAADDQLAAHTPRHRAPSDSVLSLQVHESLLNNLVSGLDLAGGQFTIDELRTRIADRLQLPLVSEKAERCTVRFADRDAVRFEFRDGLMRLSLNIAEMRVRGESARDFKVHAMYRPETDGMLAWLAPEGSLQIEGPLRNGQRLRMHAAFGKALNPERSIPVVRPATAEDARLQGLAVTQLVLDNGWLGLALGPERAGRVAQVGEYVR